MRKIAWLSLVAILLLCLCSVASADHDHWTYCDAEDMSVCAGCGVSFEVDPAHISHGDTITLFDEEDHWHVCERCNAEVFRTRHYVDCTDADQTHCHSCGYEKTSGMRVQHTYLTNDYDWLDNNHIMHSWYCHNCGNGSQEKHKAAISYEFLDENRDDMFCDTCGGWFGTINHKASCADPSVCYQCGSSASDVNLNSVEHIYQYTYESERLHHAVCACGLNNWTQSHRVHCTNDDLDTCENCGVVIGEQNMYIDHNHQRIDIDEEGHQWVCIDCGEFISRDTHFVYCTTEDKTHCIDCQYEADSELPIRHNDRRDTWDWVDNTHISHAWYCNSCGESSGKEHIATVSYRKINNYTEEWICDTCGIAFGASEHDASCADPSVCYRCGESDVNIYSVQHLNQYTYENEYNHRVTCACGQNNWTNSHRVRCTSEDMNVCDDCHTAVDEQYLIVSHNHQRLEYDEKEHRWICMNCGILVNSQPHYTYCTTEIKTHCVTCDYEGESELPSMHNNCNNDWVWLDDDQISHTWYCYGCGAGNQEAHVAAISYQPDAENQDRHNWICEICGEQIDWSLHEASCADPSTCYLCGATDITIDSLNHFEQYTYENEYDHRVTCACGQINWTRSHQVLCTSESKNVCSECNAAVNERNLYVHHNHQRFEFNEQEHYWICNDCGVLVDSQAHYTYCTEENKTRCVNCRYEGESELPSRHTDLNNSWNWYDSDHISHTWYCYDCGAGNQEAHVAAIIYQQDAKNKNVHNWICELCDERIEQAWHEASCADPSTCYLCGATDDITFDRLNHLEQYVYKDEDRHHVTCACGYRNHYQNHFAYCSNDEKGVCEGCGASVGEDKIDLNHGSTNTEHNEKEHWNICVVCNEEVYRAEHYTYCNRDDKTRCYSCGYEADSEFESKHRNTYSNWNWIDNDHISHTWYCDDCGTGSQEAHVAAISYQQDAVNKDRHNWICDTCGKQINWSWHVASCGDPSTCYLCGATNVMIDRVEHIDQNTYEDEYNHHVTCACGYKNHSQNHYAHCNNDHKDVCEGCGASVGEEKIDIQHGGSDTQYDEKEHWHVCIVCNEELSREAHYSRCTADDKTTCWNCGYESSVDLSLKHSLTNDWNWIDSDHINHLAYCVECGEGSNEWHTSTVTYLPGSKNYHEVICDSCGNIIYGTSHTASCADETETTCYQCGAADVKINRIEHVKQKTYLNMGSHRVTCACGDISYNEVHYVYCNDEDTSVCVGCGAAVDQVSIYHGNAITETDAEEHWRICMLCDQEVSREAHFSRCVDDDQSICWDCDYHGDHAFASKHNNARSSWSWVDRDHYSHTWYCYDCGEGSQEPHISTYTYIQLDNTDHLRICDTCGQEMGRSSHVASCGDHSACYQCGATGIKTDYVNHDYKYSYLSPSTHHVACACGENSWNEQHVAYCDSEDRSICEYCGESVDERSLYIEHRTEITMYNDEEHWYICNTCGEEIYRSQHYANCTADNKFVCYNCDYEADHELPLRHGWDENYWDRIDDDHVIHTWYCNECGKGSTESHTSTFTVRKDNKDWHSVICDTCGEILWQDRHFANCNNQTVCYECGETDVNIDRLQHMYEYSGSNEEYDTMACECGEYSYELKHYAFCTDDHDICNVCGKSAAKDGIVISRMAHNDVEFFSNSTEHWTVCKDCGVEDYRAGHYTFCGNHSSECSYWQCTASRENGDTVETWHDMDENNIGYCYSCGTQYSSKIMYLPTGLQRIESEAFAGTDVEILVIPASVTYIAPDAFADCNIIQYYIHASNRRVIDDCIANYPNIRGWILD